MVKGILAGRKDRTRRVKGLEKINIAPEYWLYDGVDLNIGNQHWFEILDVDGKPSEKYTDIICPYGQVGDVLWVRESYLYCLEDEFLEGMNSRIVFKASIHNDWYLALREKSNHYKWKPSIHMPKSVCRIFLEIADIRAERLQDITSEDAIKEGIDSWVDERMKSKPVRYASYCDFDNPSDPALYTSCPINSFETLWQSINGKDSWEKNPWVWVISFKRIEKPLNFS